jgi:transmembrane sensor
MSKGSFRQALIETDRALASIPLRRNVLNTRRRLAWGWPLTGGLAAAALAVMIVFALRQRPSEELTVMRLEAPAAGWRAHGDEIEIVSPTLAIDAPGFGRITATRGARLVRMPDGVRVVSGRVEFAITHRSAVPAVVHVSHGTISVLGTKFIVEQGERGGRVELKEGKIRFASSPAPGASVSGDRTVDLAPGDSLAWPLPAEPAPPLAPHAAPHATKAAPPAPSPVVDKPPVDVDHILSELASLRARARFADAAALLERALAEELPAATRERLSYELGEIETYQLHTERACRHWQSHRAQFPHGRYTDEIDAALRRLGCKETP